MSIILLILIYLAFVLCAVTIYSLILAAGVATILRDVFGVDLRNVARAAGQAVLAIAILLGWLRILFVPAWSF